MLVVTGMALALFGAETADRRAGLDDRSYLICVELRLPRHDPTGRGACITAIKTQSDAADEHRDVVLAEACISARRTGLSAGGARLESALLPDT